MAVSPRRSNRTRRSRWRIVIGLAAIALVSGRGPLTVAAEPPTPSGDEAGPAVISGPRELLRRHGVDDAEFQNLTDGRPLGDGENETLLKIMFWMRDFRRSDLDRWARGQPDVARLEKDPGPDRGQLFLLAGRVARVEARRPLPNQAQRFGLKEYYRCEFVLDDRQQPAVIFAENVPEQWLEDRPIDSRAGAFGLFLKLAGKDPGRRVPVFAARRIAWYPPTPLGNLGMDVGLFDSVVNRTGLARSRSVDEKEVSRAAREREAFYAMLDAAGRAEPGQLLREAESQLEEVDERLERTDKQGNRHFSVVPLFMEAQKQHGRLVAFSGRARRVVRISVEDPDVVARFGIDHYYEMSIYTDDSEGNPVVFCVRELPQGMPTGDGPEYGEKVRVAGFFFKLWSYHISSSGGEAEARRGGRAPRQPAPLLIGRRPVWYPYQKPPPLMSPIVGAIAGGLFVVALLGVWLALWQSGRGDKRFHDQTIAKTHSIDSQISLDEIGLAAEHGPALGGPEKTDRGNDAEK